MVKKRFSTVLALALILALAGTATAAYATASDDGSNAATGNLCGTIDGVNYIYTNDGGETWLTEDEYRAQNPDTVESLEFWEIDEFAAWMEQERSANQNRADSGEISFRDKNEDEIYVLRAWTQEDVDTLYAGWQSQLTQMKQGYKYTKPTELSNGGYLAGRFDPDVFESATAPGSTTITMPDGTEVELGHFDTAEEAETAVKKHLTEQVKAGTITQQEADRILNNKAVE